jgi:hypothetical protein
MNKILDAQDILTYARDHIEVPRIGHDLNWGALLR